jgi:formylglycine-generating enzyme required for sulfatase activity
MAEAGPKGRGAVVVVEERGRRREFGAADLPLMLGADGGADVVLDGVAGSLQLGFLDGKFFVQPQRGARNLRVGGELLAGTRALKDGDVVAFDRARLTCAIAGPALTARIDWVVTAGDTAPPDLEEVARDSGRAGEVAITPIAFKPSARSAATGRRRSVSPTTIGAAAAFALLAVVAWFAFTAKSVTFAIDPQPTALSLPGTLFKLKVGERFLLRPGSHRVVAELAGYYPLDAKVDVESLADQTIALTLTKLPGIIAITTEPEVGAQVVLDGMPFGTTPLAAAELAPGLHRLEFSAARYLAEVRELEVRGGGERQALSVTLTPDWGVVSLRTDPPGATILVDGAVAGTTPADVEIASGEHEIEALLAGYNAWRSRIVVAANQPQPLPDVTLALADGRLEIASSPSEASVSVDGEFRGRTPIALKLSPGRAHRVALSKPGYETIARELSVAADSGRRLQIDLPAQYGEIAIASTPPGAEIWVDGQERGTTPATLALTAVSHGIELRLLGYAAERAELTPRPGFPQKLERTLLAQNESSGGGFAPLIKTSAGHELKLVPGGQFTMGSSRREVGRRANEVLRPVRLTRAFYLGTREITNGELRAFNPEHDSGEFNGLSLDGDDQPAVNVTWEEAARYLNWLSVKNGLQPVYEETAGGWAPVRPLRNGYRLPTEAEWEWAARFLGQDRGLVYPWGDVNSPPDLSGNYADVTAAKILPTTLVTYNDGQPVTAPVGTYPANSAGFFDLGGNVAEWTQDFYIGDTLETTVSVDDPLGPEAGGLHVVRGSSWRSATVTDLRVAQRGSGLDRRQDVGFRIARNLQ